MRDAGIARHSLPLLVKFLLVAGFAAVGWLIVTTLSCSTASAAEQPDPGTTQQTKTAPSVGGLVDGTLTTLTGTVRTTVDTTLTTVDNTVNAVTGTVTATVQTATNTVNATTQNVVVPVTQQVLQPVTSSTTQTKKPTSSTTVAETRIDSAPIAPAPQPSAQPQTTPAPVAHTEPAAPRASHRLLPPIAAPPKPAAPAGQAQARDGAPTPLPTQPVAPTSAVSVAHDGGGNAKHPLAILTTRAATADLQPVGTPRRSTFVDSSRDQALPTTTPD